MSHIVAFVLLSGQNDVCGLQDFTETAFGYLMSVDMFRWQKKQPLVTVGITMAEELCWFAKEFCPLLFLLSTAISQHSSDIRVYTVDTDKIYSQLLRWHSTGGENDFLWLFVLKFFGFLNVLWVRPGFECFSRRSGKQLAASFMLENIPRW